MFTHTTAKAIQAHRYGQPKATAHRHLRTRVLRWLHGLRIAQDGDRRAAAPAPRLARSQ